jgi:hypothetical protein
MKHVSSSLWTSAFATSTFSSNILWSFYFLGFAIAFTCSLCSVMSLLTPIRSEVDHAKASLFLSRKANNSAYSLRVILVSRQTALSGTLGSNATFLMSPSALMAFLNSSELLCRCSRLIAAIARFFSYKMDILVGRCKALFNISGIFLAAKD